MSSPRDSNTSSHLDELLDESVDIESFATSPTHAPRFHFLHHTDETAANFGPSKTLIETKMCQASSHNVEMTPTFEKNSLRKEDGEPINSAVEDNNSKSAEPQELSKRPVNISIPTVITNKFITTVGTSFDRVRDEIVAEVVSHFNSESLRLHASHAHMEQQLADTISASSFAVRMNQQRSRQVGGLVHIVQRVREASEALNIQKEFIKLWRMQLLRGRQTRAKIFLAVRLAFARIEGEIFKEWRIRAVKSIVHKKILSAKAQAEAEKIAALREGEELRQALVKEGALLKEQLRKERDLRQSIQGNLQKVFLRGVNAMNWEAMCVLQDQNIALSISNSNGFETQESPKLDTESGWHNVKSPKNRKSPIKGSTSSPQHAQATNSQIDKSPKMRTQSAANTAVCSVAIGATIAPASTVAESRVHGIHHMVPAASLEGTSLPHVTYVAPASGNDRTTKHWQKAGRI